MVSILNNIGALGASRQLQLTGTGLQRTIQRLTTGRRINTAADDAAGLGISNQLGADIRIAAQGRRNANDGTSFLQVADGVLDEVTNLLTRGSELAQQAETGTISDVNRAALDAEFQNILTSIADIGLHTTFNGQTVFGGSLTVAVAGFSAVAVSVGTIAAPGGPVHVTGHPGGVLLDPGTSGTIPVSTWILPNWGSTAVSNVNITSPNVNAGGITVSYNSPAAGDITYNNTTGTQDFESFAFDFDYNASTNILGLTSGATNLLTMSNAQSAAPLLEAALASVSSIRATLGAGEQQLNSVSNSLGIQVENFTSAYSQIRDANLADEVVNLTRFQVLQQSGTSALAQANQSSKSILSLIA